MFSNMRLNPLILIYGFMARLFYMKMILSALQYLMEMHISIWMITVITILAPKLQSD